MSAYNSSNQQHATIVVVRQDLRFAKRKVVLGNLINFLEWSPPYSPRRRRAAHIRFTLSPLIAIQSEGTPTW